MFPDSGNLEVVDLKNERVKNVTILVNLLSVKIPLFLLSNRM